MLDLVITNEEDMIKDMEYLSPLDKNNHLISIVKTAEKKLYPAVTQEIMKQ